MQCEPLKVREFETGADMIAAAKSLRDRFRQLPPMRQPPAVVAPPIVAEPPQQKGAPLPAARPPVIRISGNVFPTTTSPRTERPTVLVHCPYAGEMVERPVDLPRCKDIVEATAAHFRVSVIELLSQRRTWNIVRPRQIAMYLCCTITMRGLPFVGTVFDRDHTTVLHARDKIKVLLRDPDVVSAIAAITGELRNRFTF